jgi:hypothetical protein
MAGLLGQIAARAPMMAIVSRPLPLDTLAGFLDRPVEKPRQWGPGLPASSSAQGARGTPPDTLTPAAHKALRLALLGRKDLPLALAARCAVELLPLHDLGPVPAIPVLPVFPASAAEDLAAERATVRAALRTYWAGVWDNRWATPQLTAQLTAQLLAAFADPASRAQLPIDAWLEAFTWGLGAAYRSDRSAQSTRERCAYASARTLLEAMIPALVPLMAGDPSAPTFAVLRQQALTQAMRCLGAPPPIVNAIPQAMRYRLLERRSAMAPPSAIRHPSRPPRWRTRRSDRRAERGVRPRDD